ncbi:MAG TPA: DUF1003 domain-containing protein [Abditibacterium sp.]
MNPASSHAPKLATPTAQNHDFSAMNHVVARNIQALLEVRQHDEAALSRQERIADRITRFTGSMTFVFLHLALFSAWIVANLGWLPIKKFDPSFVMLAMFASVEAIFLSTFVLISQNRMQTLANKQADLDLHVSLLAEHEITHLIKLTSAIAAHLGLDVARDAEIVAETQELSQDVYPENVLQEIENEEQKAAVS